MCEYCEKKKSIVFNRLVESHLFISKEEKRIYWRIDDIPEKGLTCVSYADINYCPMCGRKLTNQKTAQYGKGSKMEMIETKHDLLTTKYTKVLESFHWRSWKDNPPKFPDSEGFVFCGHQKYDWETEMRYFVDVGHLDVDGTLCMYNDWDEGEQVFEVDYWFPLPHHPDEPTKEEE